MKAVIQEVTFVREWESQFGKMYSFKVKYDDKFAKYDSKYKDQKKFIPGQEAEFTEEDKSYKDKQGVEHPYIAIKPVQFNKQSNFGKALTKEKARYSAMVISYSKDLVVAGKVELKDLPKQAWELFNLMNEMDKTLE